MFHKPRAVVVTRRDERGRKTVYDLLPHWVSDENWAAVGRLDRDTRGLLLLVDDPSLVERLAAPGRFTKVYETWIRGRINASQLQNLKSGIASPVGVLRCKDAVVIRTLGPRTELRVSLEEGKNRHIRRMFGALRDSVHNTPLKVVDLKRIEFGPIILDVPSGAWRLLSEKETAMLLSRPAL